MLLLPLEESFEMFTVFAVSGKSAILGLTNERDWREEGRDVLLDRLFLMCKYANSLRAKAAVYLEKLSNKP